MCGIVGAIAKRDVASILLQGLERLEYRGYDSAGMALFDPESGHIQRIREKGKVARLGDQLHRHPLKGHLGIAHTRWATHGIPSEKNAHPHFSHDQIAIVHNGIIENFEILRHKLIEAGYAFESETDTEVIAHLIHYYLHQKNDLMKAVQNTINELEGAYALGIIDAKQPDVLIAARHGSPLVLGLGVQESYIASDPLALLPLTQRFIYLQEGDVAVLTLEQINIFDKQGKAVKRDIHTSQLNADTTSKGRFKHYMQKEIFDQPQALSDVLEGHYLGERVIEQSFGPQASTLFKTIERVTIVACGTSYHAGLVARYWIEALAGLPCSVEIASENRYREAVVEPHTLFVAISQSGETADTLSALRQAKQKGFAATLGICNVSESSLVREADMTFMTRAGAEVGVASTKAFTTQLTALLLLTICLGKHKKLTAGKEAELIDALKLLPRLTKEVLELDPLLSQMAKQFIKKKSALYLGRGTHFPIALEGALKLKEISYVHAEAYSAGELKHGPLALVDEDMPVVVIAPNNALLPKLLSNIKEIEARNGELFIFLDEKIVCNFNPSTTIIKIPSVPEAISPMIYTIPLQLLSYHVAVLKGTDVDQPRNLAKSVTVE